MKPPDSLFPEDEEFYFKVGDEQYVAVEQYPGTGWEVDPTKDMRSVVRDISGMTRPLFRGYIEHPSENGQMALYIDEADMFEESPYLCLRAQERYLVWRCVPYEEEETPDE